MNPWLALWLAFGLGCASAPSDRPPRLRGPMEVRNQHPAQLAVLHMAPANGEVQRAGEVALRWDNSYSSLFLSGSGPGPVAGDPDNAFVMDGEILRTSVSAHVGLGAGLQLDVEVPVGHTTGGFLDGFVIDWHKAFGFPDQGRTAAGKGRFEVGARRGSDLVLLVDNHQTGLLDIPVGLTWGMLPNGGNQPLSLAVRGAVELPTGDQDRGFGSGQLDASLGLVGGWHGDGWGAHGFVQHTWAGTPRRARAAGFEFADVTSGGLGVEAYLTPDTSLLLQTEWETSTLRNLGFSRVARDQWLLWAGLRQRLGDNLHLELALGEDLSQYVAPDFSLFFSLVWFP